jgi:hypothetical protein
MKKVIGLGGLVFLIAAAIVFADFKLQASAAGPVRHPNLVAAQKYLNLAYEKITAAQKANEYDLGGHAQKAKELIEQAKIEVKLAAEAANK